MMVPLEDLPSSNNSEEESSTGNPQETNGVPNSTNQAATPQNGPGWKCYCCCNSGLSRSKIEPVIFQPLDDVYLQLKPHRRLRVIHINNQGALPNPKPYYLQNDGESDSDDEDYWFQNADPKRLKITPKPPSSVQNGPKRIFHKFEPQIRPTLEGLSPPEQQQQQNNSIPGRLQRKTIKEVTDDEEDDDDDDEEEENETETTKNLQEEENENNDKTEEEKLSPKINRNEQHPPSPSLKPSAIDVKLSESESKGVLTFPEPGESSTDTNTEDNDPNVENDINAGNASISEAGQKLGGMANVAFESEEDTPDLGIQVPNNDVKPERPAAANPGVILPALFFIHGVGGSANAWFNQLAYFVNLGHEVVAPDLLGHGFSSAPDRPKSYTFVKLLRDTLTIFDHFIPRYRECIVVAHSYGSSMAVALARSRPENVKLLVLCSSGGPTPLAPPTQLSKVPPSILACIKPFLKCKFKSSQNQGQKYTTRGKSTKIQEAFDIPAYVLHHIMMGQHWPEGDASYHRRISIPTLLVYGMKDPLVSLVEMCEMERTIPKAYLELVPLAGHMIMQDQPKELNIMLKKFIAKYFSNQ